MLIIFLLLIPISFSLKCGEYNTDTMNITAYYISNNKYFSVGLMWISSYDLGISTIISCDKYNTNKIIIEDKIISIIDLVTYETIFMSKNYVYYYGYNDDKSHKIITLYNGNNLQFFIQRKYNKYYKDIFLLDSGRLLRYANYLNNPSLISQKCGKYDINTLNITAYYISDTKYNDDGLVLISSYEFGISTIISCNEDNKYKIIIKDKIISIIRPDPSYIYYMSKKAIYINSQDNKKKILNLNDGQNIQFENINGYYDYDIYYLDSGKIYKFHNN